MTTFEVADANVRSVTIEHSVSSSVDLVGLQVRGQLPFLTCLWLISQNDMHPAHPT